MVPEATKPIAGANMWRYRLLLGAAAVIAAAAAVMAGITLWSAPRRAADVTPTVTASSSPYSDEQIAAAKKDACDAATRTDGPMTDVQNALWDTPKGSSEEPAALAAFQRVTLVEIEYLKSRTRPEAPEAVRTALHTYISAVLATVDGVTRGVPVSEKVAAVKAAGAQLDKACKEG
jgi:hypothetical protein